MTDAYREELARLARALATGAADEVCPALADGATAADVRLSDDVLDRIDEIVAPGVTLNPADNGWVSPALAPAARRR